VFTIVQFSFLIVHEFRSMIQYTVTKHTTFQRKTAKIRATITPSEARSPGMTLCHLSLYDALVASPNGMEPAMSAANAATLILSEPDRATRQLYARELGKHWRVIAVENADEVADVLEQQTVDAVIIELGAANEQEWTSLARVLRCTARHNTPVIVCSAVDARSKGYGLGVSAYLVKPVLPQQLIGEVARWLNGQAQREQLM
jgi:CheY-like chemotaxis protein